MVDKAAAASQSADAEPLAAQKGPLAKCQTPRACEASAHSASRRRFADNTAASCSCVRISPCEGLCSARCSHAGAQQRRCSSACDGLLPGVDTECARPAQAAMRPNAFRTRSERRPHYQAPPKRPRYTTPAGADALKPLPSTCARSQRTPPPSR